MDIRQDWGFWVLRIHRRIVEHISDACNETARNFLLQGS